MNNTDIPTRFPIPFANAAGPSFIRPIPVDSQIGINDGAASLADGFPPDCFDPIAAGGIPPDGKDFNGLLNQATDWLRFLSTGTLVTYDSAFATAIGGYPRGAFLASSVTNGLIWRSTVNDNTTDPDGGGAANWSGGFNHSTIGGEVLPSGLILNWGSLSQIGSAGSQAIAFAIPYKSAVFQVVVSNDANGPPVAFHAAANFTLTGATIWSATASGVAAGAGTSFRWFAIGI